MKKVILTLAILTLATFSYAQFSMSLDFVYENNTFTDLAAGAYNFVEDHYYACDYDDAAEMVAILNSDGTTGAGSLDTSGLTLGTLNVFAICCGSDGVIYGSSNTDPDLTIIRWASESATPTQQFITDLHFVRCMDIRGAGADTIIACTGQDDNGVVDILTTTDGSTFVLSETTPGLDGVKQGLAINEDATVIFGGQGYYGDYVHKFNRGDGSWPEDTNFDADSENLFEPCPMGHWDARDVLFCLDTHAGSTDQTANFSALAGADATIMDQADTGVIPSAYGYGTVDVGADMGGGEARFIARADNGYYCGKVSLSWPSPTPTPPVLSANSVWGLYE